MTQKEKVYLDYAASTPVDPKVVKAMLLYFTEKFGNPSSLHSYAQETKEALEQSREKMANFIGAQPKEIIFTSSATESNNLALKGVAFYHQKKGKHILVSSIEHDCVLNSAEWLKKQGFEIEKIPVDKYGTVNPEAVREMIREDTILVSVMHANNEIGTIEPISKIGKICQEKGVLFHTDSAQTFGKIPVDVRKMNVDLLTASSQKMYGPRGAAFLFIKKGTKIEPLIHGGGHESGIRSSTENVAAIVGFTKATELCLKEMKKESERQAKLRDKIIKEILKIPDTFLNGHPKNRLPNNVHFRFSFVEGEAVVMMLDYHGIAASTASACSSPKLEPSHVLLACGLKTQEAHGSLRISLGRWTSEKDVKYLLKVLPKVIEDLRKISPFKKNVY